MTNDEINRKEIPNHPDYFADTFGGIWSMKRNGGYGTIPKHPKLLKPFCRRGKHPRRVVSLSENGKTTTYTVAELILTAFIGERPRGMYACHGELGSAAATFHDINQFANKRVRHTLQRRRGHRGYGWDHVSSDYIYGRLGLFYNYSLCKL